MSDNINRIYGVPTTTDVQRYKGARYLSPEVVDSYYIGNQFTTVNGLLARVLDPNKPVNPPFDPRIWSVPQMRGHAMPRLLRGRMTQLKTEPVAVTGASGPMKRSLNFLWNPTAVTHGFSFDSSAVPTAERTAGDAGVIMQQGQSVAFSLIFNRTYEVAYQRNNPGVLVDTQALEYMLGTYEGGAIAATDVLVVFGSTENMKPFAYTGWVTGCEIEYLQFSRRMIPTVAVANITLARRFVPSNMGTGVTGAGVTGVSSNPGVLRPALPGGSTGQVI